MRKLFLIPVLLTLAGCGVTGVYKVSSVEYRQQVKTLGVLPVLVDGRSKIEHPQSAELVALLRRAAEGRANNLIKTLRKKKGYFDVRAIDQPSRLVADKLLVEARFNELGQPLGYQLEPTYLADLCREAVIDGVLILTLQGAVHNEKRWSRNTFESLTTDYNDILGTASVVTADGRVLWEMTAEEAEKILSLQYADFDEAYYNKTDAVRLKFIRLAGLQKTLLQAAAKNGEPAASEPLDGWIAKVSAALSPSLFQ